MLKINQVYTNQLNRILIIIIVEILIESVKRIWIV
jgi:hypothetical protein